MTNLTNRVLYTGFTSKSILERVYEHRAKLVSGFTAKYNVIKLVWYECCNDRDAALTRERQIKGWKRERIISLIKAMNPGWRNLTETLQL